MKDETVKFFKSKSYLEPGYVYAPYLPLADIGKGYVSSATIKLNGKKNNNFKLFKEFLKEN